MRYLKGACTHCEHTLLENSLAGALRLRNSLERPSPGQVSRSSLKVSIRLSNSLKRWQFFV